MLTIGLLAIILVLVTVNILTLALLRHSTRRALVAEMRVSQLAAMLSFWKAQWTQLLSTNPPESRGWIGGQSRSGELLCPEPFNPHYAASSRGAEYLFGSTPISPAEGDPLRLPDSFGPTLNQF